MIVEDWFRDSGPLDAIKLGLESTTKDEILNELISLLGLDEKSEEMLYKMLKRRENLGSTGFGGGVLASVTTGAVGAVGGR